ncbi:flagellar hook capping FlgD N-terminal domain-containing protein [Hyphobacterium sp. HN65]|uniref:Basal-body rod modification protein FlgD n=1 Tax=Hyphobacterium lacteum TaxID=3116575 RepID=A0ABU7LQC4_9PROT|nr:flagellar hook capping FlgD N-terminal domain-containing protein [Hyphobacterium sp. HN65]MEE2526115.1 flagellar hook capping FlgD N-terminal domain-containing protein [Hyphobacterium sp. HN65]
MTTGIESLGLSSTTRNSQSALANNFEMFLTLLTEQMKAQDPLNPLDSTEFVNQLVNFSSVEQEIRSNQNLESLITIQAAAAQSTAVGFIGREATVGTPQGVLQDGQAEWTYVLPEDTQGTLVTITDENGRTVATFEGEVTAGRHTVEWDGTDINGGQLDDGVYSMSITALNADGQPITADIQTTARVTGVDFSGSEVVVQMGDIEVLLSSVRSIREV